MTTPVPGGRGDPSAPAWPAGGSGSRPRWSESIAVPAFLALREGTRPLVIVAPHGGRRQRPIRRGDSVNDLHTAEIAWELATRLDAHAIVNHGLDRNEIDLNRISDLMTRAPEVLALLVAAIGEAARGGEVPLVLFVHGWNMVVPCCDIGIGLRRRGSALTGRYPTMSRSCYDGTIAAMEHELAARGVSVAIGRRYTASGRDNAAQLFSGRHADHDDAAVAGLGRLAMAGRVDAAQLELGIPLRWKGELREALLEGLVEGLRSHRTATPRSGIEDEVAEIIEVPRANGGWRLPLPAPEDVASGNDGGFSLQAVLDADSGVATFCGVEPTGRHSMAARFSLVCTDGTMLLLVGEGEWSGEAGRYGLEGFTWHAEEDGRRMQLRLCAPMIRYRTHDAYLDLEQGLLGSEVVRGEISLEFEAVAEDRGQPRGRLRGRVVAGGIDLAIDTMAFVDRGGRRQAQPRSRIRVVVEREERDVVVARSEEREETSLELATGRGRLGVIQGTHAAHPLAEAEILARVPVWRPHGDGTFSRWTFGIARCRFTDEGEDRIGLFEALEVFRRPSPVS